jgi:hypothetical protein
MIYFSNTEVRPTPAYETQRLFSVYGGDRYVASELKINVTRESGANSSEEPTFAHRLGASVVRNSKTGKTYLKVINALPEKLTLDVEGLTIPTGTKAIGFDGLPEDQQVVIKTEETTGKTLELPPYSIRVIEL